MQPSAEEVCDIKTFLSCHICSSWVDVLCSNGDEILFNTQQGHILRTKKFGVDEGGVATGYSVLDSPCLVDSFPVAMERKNLNTL